MNEFGRQDDLDTDTHNDHVCILKLFERALASKKTVAVLTLSILEDAR